MPGVLICVLTGCEALVLMEDSMLAGFVPLLSAPVDTVYINASDDKVLCRKQMSSAMNWDKNKTKNKQEMCFAQQAEGSIKKTTPPTFKLKIFFLNAPLIFTSNLENTIFLA